MQNFSRSPRACKMGKRSCHDLTCWILAEYSMNSLAGSTFVILKLTRHAHTRGLSRMYCSSADWTIWTWSCVASILIGKCTLIQALIDLPWLTIRVFAIDPLFTVETSFVRLRRRVVVNKLQSSTIHVSWYPGSPLLSGAPANESQWMPLKIWGSQRSLRKPTLILPNWNFVRGWTHLGRNTLSLHNMQRIELVHPCQELSYNSQMKGRSPHCRENVAFQRLRMCTCHPRESA